mmetsp:Transcript_18027/g.28031  ORF Transcript_18027/g.28031 Transcript_18027/m.28031 type:complete len:204 (-) Transcript_18027:922-1533(-)
MIDGIVMEVLLFGARSCFTMPPAIQQKQKLGRHLLRCKSTRIGRIPTSFPGHDSPPGVRIRKARHGSSRIHSLRGQQLCVDDDAGILGIACDGVVQACCRPGLMLMQMLLIVTVVGVMMSGGYGGVSFVILHRGRHDNEVCLVRACIHGIIRFGSIHLHSITTNTTAMLRGSNVPYQTLLLQHQIIRTLLPQPSDQRGGEVSR